MKRMWFVVEPSEFVGGWHIDAIAEHLEAMMNGQIELLIINIPPRCTKSTLISVFFPAFVWTRDPSVQFLCTSYAERLSVRDSVKCRRVIQHPVYQDILQYSAGIEDFEMTSDQNTKLKFENNFNGYRLATSFDGQNTGEGGDYIIADDPNNVRKSESLVERSSVNTTWDEVMPTRSNNPKKPRRIIVQQRTNEDDLSGHVMTKDLPEANLLILPAEYEGMNRCKTVLNFRDPRRKVGEPLCPDRFGPKELEKLKATMTTFAISGQLQQRPTPRKGGFFEDKFRVTDIMPDGKIVKSIRYVDKAATQDGGKRTAGVLMHKLLLPIRDALNRERFEYVIEDCYSGQWNPGNREKVILEEAILDGEKVTTVVEQEPGSGGKESAQGTVAMLLKAGLKAGVPDKVSDSKEARAEPYSTAVSNEQVWLLTTGRRAAKWIKQFVANHLGFPKATFRDEVDAGSGAFNRLNDKVTESGAWGSEYE